jgi:hypothetical protein
MDTESKKCEHSHGASPGVTTAYAACQPSICLTTYADLKAAGLALWLACLLLWFARFLGGLNHADHTAATRGMLLRTAYYARAILWALDHLGF